jgi:7,8-dihydropterin-6-yl-methyl-4-(beta-D-ribofuranosyl)aminobenzene 5'-phosphate synthase
MSWTKGAVPPSIRSKPGIAVLLLLLLLIRTPNVQQVAAETDAKTSQDVMITIVYDDHPLDKRLRAGFGFACIIQGLPDTILFDTGARGELLLSNMASMGIRPGQIGSVVLSHAHGDHTGGLPDFLQAHGQVKVFVPRAFPSGFKQDIRHSGAKVVETDRPCRVCEGAWTTGVLKRGIEEQGLYLTTSKGLVVITGCAHPGVVNMAEAARRHTGRPVYAVLGGFHMGGASVDEINRVVRDLREMGVQQVAPCHCSGDKARRLMKEAFGEGYLLSGVGAQFAFGKLKPSENR